MCKTLERRVSAWGKFWFTPGSLTRLAIFRIHIFFIHPPLAFSMMALASSSSGARLSMDHLLQRLRRNHAAQQFTPKDKANDASRFEKIGAWIRRHITARHGMTKLAVLFDGQCPLCIRSVTIVDLFDWRGKFVFRDVNDWEQISRDFPGLDQHKSLEEMQVMVPRGNRHEALAGFYAFRKIAQHLPLGMLLWPFLFIPGVPFIGTRVYRFIASRRKRLTGGARCSFHTCEIPMPAKNV